MPGEMDTDLVGEIEPKLWEAIVQFSSSINNRKIEGSYNIASATVSLLKHVINGPEFVNATELLFSFRKFGCELIRALPQETIVGNMVRRVLRIIREEYNMAGKSSETAGGAEASGASLQKLVRAAARRSLHPDMLPDLREAVLEHITEFEAELETSVDNIAAQAVEHIHANELIFTLGASRLVEKFLLQAAKKRTFHVIVAEGNEPEQGHKMAANLGRAGIETTLISSGACMGVMSRVNKVISGTRAVLASGGLRAQTGFETVALAARHYRVPVIILSPLYKLCPLHQCTYEEYNFNALRSPEAALPYKTGAVVHKSQVYSPQYDYVDPDAVTLFVTNVGGSAPSYIYRLISELYHPDDFQT